jgi:hypothetical protein
MASIKDLKRMCEMQEHCTTDCPLCRENVSCLPESLPDNADEIVDEWVAEHPVKTYATDFFSKFPDAQRKATTGIPIPCIRVIYSEFYDRECPKGGCYECWNRRMKEDE